MVHLADVSRSHLYKCATIKEHHSQVYTCQPIQFTSIEYIFVISGGGGGGGGYGRIGKWIQENRIFMRFCFVLNWAKRFKNCRRSSRRTPSPNEHWLHGLVQLISSEVRFEVSRVYFAQHCFFLPLPHMPVGIQNATATSEKKQKTPAYIREIQVYRLWTKAYSQKGLTAMQANLHKWLSQSMSLSHSRLQSSATRASGQFIV